jgi:gluconolactonase
MKLGTAITTTWFAAAALSLLAGCSSSTAAKKGPAEKSAAGVGNIVRLDPAFDELVPNDAQIEKVAGGFTFIEGPLWRPNIGSGALWFSDVIGNVVRQWTPDGKVIELLNPGGYDGKGNLPAGGYNGPNGMATDKDDTVLLCQHGYRRIVRIDKNMQITTVVDKFEGKRLNSPNDVVFRSDGAFYFTDPPYGLPKGDADPAKELKFNGVYRYKNGKLQAVIKDLSTPNGIAFSPDQNTLYIGNSEETHKFWEAYDVNPDGTVKNPRLIKDVTSEKEEGVPDGMKVDSKGNIYGTGPGGIWVFSPDGRHLGTIKPPEIPANCGWGDDGKSLYMTARTGLYRIKLAVAGETPLYR